MFSENGVVNASSLVVRSARDHLLYVRPAAAVEPSMYAGKVETTVLTMIGDLYNVSATDIVNKRAFFRACTGFNEQWRMNDEVLDEVRYTTDPVTVVDLQEIPVNHKYAGRMGTGRNGMDIALQSTLQLIPGRDPESRSRRDRIEGLLYQYTEKVVETANNPQYHQGDILSYPIALQAKQDITGHLGETGAELYATLLGLPEDQRAIEFFGQLSTAMQFGDDYLDWRKDWRDFSTRKAEVAEQLRSGENLLLATLEENSDEKDACAEVLFDTKKRAAVWFERLAPDVADLFRHRFQTQLDQLPAHPRGESLKQIASLTFNNLLYRAPESPNWFARWAKY